MGYFKLQEAFSFFSDLVVSATLRLLKIFLPNVKQMLMHIILELTKQNQQLSTLLGRCKTCRLLASPLTPISMYKQCLFPAESLRDLQKTSSKTLGAFLM